MLDIEGMEIVKAHQGKRNDGSNGATRTAQSGAIFCSSGLFATVSTACQYHAYCRESSESISDAREAHEKKRNALVGDPSSW